MRFVTHESEGYLSQAKTSARRMGITVTVHDTLLNHRLVGLYRSEDEVGGWRTNERCREIARAKAQERVKLLEAENG